MSQQVPQEHSSSKSASASSPVAQILRQRWHWHCRCSSLAPVQHRDDFPIAIIGAGFSGIGAAIQLLKAGIQSFTIFERASEIGGTWRENTYPGCACDVPSHVYSFSFEQNPTWSRRYATSWGIQ